jgi:hypothetical protein
VGTEILLFATAHFFCDSEAHSASYVLALSAEVSLLEVETHHSPPHSAKVNLHLYSAIRLLHADIFMHRNKFTATMLTL